MNFKLSKKFFKKPEPVEFLVQETFLYENQERNVEETKKKIQQIHFMFVIIF